MLDIGFLITQYAHRVASNRYRIASPIRELKALGVKAGLGMGLITVVGKTHADFRPQLESAQKKGHKVLVDLCDIHKDPLHFANERVLDMADGVVCNTAALARAFKERYPNLACPFFIVEDPFEFPEAPVALPGRGGRLLWFGHSSNWYGMVPLLPHLTGQLHLITTSMSEAVFWPKHQEWSLSKVLDGLAWADIALLPTNKDADTPDIFSYGHCKGANRLVEAVRRGRYAINDGVVEAYRDYGLWSGDILEGIQWVRKNPEEALDQVRNAQSIVRARNDPQIIARQWLAAANAVGGKLWHWTEPMTG